MRQSQKTKTVGSVGFPSPASVTINEFHNDLLSDFIDSTSTLIEELEGYALSYEKDPTNKEIEDAIKRVLHLLKGESGVMGAVEMSDTFHEVENGFESSPVAQRSDLLLKTCDWTSQAVAVLSGKDSGLDMSTSSWSPVSEAKPARQPQSVQTDLTAQEIMKSELLTITPETQIYDAIAMLVSRNVTAIPVVNPDNSVAGILSEKDVLRLLYEMQDNMDTAGDYMTASVVSFPVSAPVSEIVDCLLENNFRRVMIVEDDILKGMISRRNIITKYLDLFYQAHPECKRNKPRIFTARDVMTQGLLTVYRKTPIYTVADVMIRNNVTGLPVVSEDMTLAGIISEKDFLKISLDLKYHNTTAEEFMTSSVVSFGPDDSLVDICDCLIQNPFRRVTILENNRVCGIISRRDIIRLILQRRASAFKRRRQDPTA